MRRPTRIATWAAALAIGGAPGALAADVPDPPGIHARSMARVHPFDHPIMGETGLTARQSSYTGDAEICVGARQATTTRNRRGDEVRTVIEEFGCGPLETYRPDIATSSASVTGRIPTVVEIARWTGNRYRIVKRVRASAVVNIEWWSGVPPRPRAEATTGGSECHSLPWAMCSPSAAADMHSETVATGTIRFLGRGRIVKLPWPAPGEIVWYP